jgi:hypothetical protein
VRAAKAFVPLLVRVLTLDLGSVARPDALSQEHSGGESRERADDRAENNAGLRVVFVAIAKW